MQAHAGGAAFGLLPLLIAGSAQAVEFSLMDNQLSGSIDTTLSYGAMWRVQGRDKDNISDINADDGNRNFDTGLVSEVYKATSDLSLKYDNYGAFVRGTAYYDTQIMDKRNDYYGTTGGVERPSQSFPMTISPRTPAISPGARARSSTPTSTAAGMWARCRWGPRWAGR